MKQYLTARAHDNRVYGGTLCAIDGKEARELAKKIGVKVVGEYIETLNHRSGKDIINFCMRNKLLDLDLTNEAVFVDRAEEHLDAFLNDTSDLK